MTTVDVNGPWLVANMLSRVQGEKVESTKVNHLSEGPSARERQLERENKDLVVSCLVILSACDGRTFTLQLSHLPL